MAAKNDTLLLPVQIRSGRFRSYDVDDFAEATNRDQEWKNTPLDRLQPLFGPLQGGTTPYEWECVEPRVSPRWIGRNDPAVGSTGLIPEDILSANAWSSFTDALLVDIPDGVVLDAPAALRRVGEDATAHAAHTIIRAGRGARGLILLDYRGDARLAENVEIIAGQGADLTVVTVEDWGATALHAGAVFMALDEGAQLKHVQVSLGGDVIRTTPTAVFRGARGRLLLDGVYFVDAGQHIEHQIYVDHAAPDCYSRVTYKGALQGRDAHAVWIGDALIRSFATGTDTYELNRNLVLTRGAHADSVPNLEIETGEIVGAGHASATGRFDDEQLFYLQARGIPESEARKLVVRGFLMEIVDRIGDRELEDRLADALDAELAQTSE